MGQVFYDSQRIYRLGVPRCLTNLAEVAGVEIDRFVFPQGSMLFITVVARSMNPLLDRGRTPDYRQPFKMLAVANLAHQKEKATEVASRPISEIWLLR